MYLGLRAVGKLCLCAVSALFAGLLLLLLLRRHRRSNSSSSFPPRFCRRGQRRAPSRLRCRFRWRKKRSCSKWADPLRLCGEAISRPRKRFLCGSIMFLSVLSHTASVQFVLDAGDVVQLSTAVALLGSLLCTESVRTKPVFVVLNKADLAGDDGCALAMRRLRADALSKARSSDAPLSFRVISALSGRGLSELLADLTR